MMKRYNFEIIAAYPKRKFAVYEKKENFWDKIRKMFGVKKKKKRKMAGGKELVEKKEKKASQP